MLVQPHHVAGGLESAGAQSAAHEGQRSLADLEEIVARARRLGRAVDGGRRALTVAATPPAGELLLPLLAEPELRLRALELPSAAIRAYAAKNLFDVALTTGLGPGARLGLPPSWVARPVGCLEKALFAPPALLARLGPAPISSARLADVPFVEIGHCLGGEYVEADDEGAPLPLPRRTIRHEAGTPALAFALAVRSESLVFGPVLGARPFLEAGLLALVPAPGWTVEEPLHLACNQDRVTARQQLHFEAVLTARLATDKAA